MTPLYSHYTTLHVLYSFSDTELSISCNNNHRGLVVGGHFSFLAHADSTPSTVDPSPILCTYSPDSPALSPASLDLPFSNIFLSVTNVRLLPSLDERIDPSGFTTPPPVLSTFIGISPLALGFPLCRCVLIRTLSRKLSTAG